MTTLASQPSTFSDTEMSAPRSFSDAEMAQPRSFSDEEMNAPQGPSPEDEWNQLPRQARIAYTLDTKIRERRDKWSSQLKGIGQHWAQEVPGISLAGRPLLRAHAADTVARVNSATGGPVDKLPAHEEEAYNNLADLILEDERQQAYEARQSKLGKAIDWGAHIGLDVAGAVAAIQSFVGLGAMAGTAIAGEGAATVGAAIAEPLAFEGLSQVSGRAGGEAPTPGIGLLQYLPIMLIKGFHQRSL